MAIRTFRESEVSAAEARQAETVHRHSGIAQIFGGIAAGRGHGAEIRCLIPADGGTSRSIAAKGFIGEEGEDLVLPDGAADAAAVGVEVLLVAVQAALRRSFASGRSTYGVGSVPTLIGIHAGPVCGEEEAAVKVVGAALGSDLDLRAGEPAEFSVVGV